MYVDYKLEQGYLGWIKQIEEARQELDAILAYVLGPALGLKTHVMEGGIYR